MKTLDGTLYRRALDCSGPQSAHTRVVSRAGSGHFLDLDSRAGYYTMSWGISPSMVIPALIMSSAISLRLQRQLDRLFDR